MADREAERRGVSRRLLLEHLLWAERERNLVEPVAELLAARLWAY